MNAIAVKVHGKINLTLDVLRRRTDGYHEIRSVMQSIAQYDRLIIRKAQTGIELVTKTEFTEPENNLAYKAAELFFSAVSLHAGVKIELEKNLPISAGLAGGSADAAGVLWSLNKLYQTNLSLTQLQVLAQELGADVPFCIQGGTLLAEGIGEKLSLLPALPDYAIVLVSPNYSISTKEVYQALTPSMFGDNYTTGLINALDQKQNITDCFGNVLEQISSSQVPEIKVWQQRLLESGAESSIMSGSGPTVMGVFTSKELALQFLNKWNKQCRMTLTKPWNTGITVIKE